MYVLLLIKNQILQQSYGLLFNHFIRVISVLRVTTCIPALPPLKGTFMHSIRIVFCEPMCTVINTRIHVCKISILILYAFNSHETLLAMITIVYYVDSLLHADYNSFFFTTGTVDNARNHH